MLIKDNPSYIRENCLEPEPYWDDWTEIRNGMRGHNDPKRIQSPYMWFAESLGIRRWNRKNKKLLARRKARQWMALV